MTNRRKCSRRHFLRTTVSIGLAVGRIGFLPGKPSWAADPPKLKTVSPGVITVAMTGDMPMSSIRDKRLIGTDGDMVTAIAERLGLGVKPSLMEFSAMIESVKTGRTDAMIGNVSWNPLRASVMALTDAIYYSGAFFTTRKDNPLQEIATVADLKGHSIGTLSGFAKVPELKRVPGTTEVKLYDTTDACVRDLLAGRLDFAVLDPAAVSYMVHQRPDFNLKLLSLKFDPDFPLLTSKQHTVIGMNLQNYDLFDAFNAGVKWLWRTKKNLGFLARYGITNPQYGVPPERNLRIGVDRDEQGNVIGPGKHPTKDFSGFFS